MGLERGNFPAPRKGETTMRTTIDQHKGIHGTGLVMRALYEVVTDESIYPDEATALDAHAAQVELQRLDCDDRQAAMDLLAAEEYDTEGEASVIRRCIAEVVGCCPYCSAQGQITRSEDGPDAREVSLDVGNTEPLRGALCRGCRDTMVAPDIAKGR
jgi:hypothetical protein